MIKCPKLLFVTAVQAPLLVALGSGCVERTITISTQPEGADVYLNDEKVGTSPVTTSFMWYGDYDVTIRHAGYATLHESKRIVEPVYQWIGIDLICEALLPIKFKDERYWSFELAPRKQTTREELLHRAREMQARTTPPGTELP